MIMFIKDINNELVNLNYVIAFELSELWKTEKYVIAICTNRPYQLFTGSLEECKTFLKRLEETLIEKGMVLSIDC